ncbi:MAG: chaperone modulator CbpM [Gammaproteobacteria bacterium]
MTQKSASIVTGIVLDEETELGLDELARACAVRSEWVVALVEEGVIEPAGEAREYWRFAGHSLARARTAARLAHDLEINLAGIALALDLMDELESLRARLHELDNDFH